MIPLNISWWVNDETFITFLLTRSIELHWQSFPVWLQLRPILNSHLIKDEVSRFRRISPFSFGVHPLNEVMVYPRVFSQVIFVAKLSLGIYKNDEITRKVLGLVTKRLMAKEIMSCGHLWHLLSLPFLPSQKHFDRNLRIWANRLGQLGKYLDSVSFDITLSSCCSSSVSANSASLTSLKLGFPDVPISTDWHLGNMRPRDVRGA